MQYEVCSMQPACRQAGKQKAVRGTLSTVHCLLLLLTSRFIIANMTIIEYYILKELVKL